jgi:uncharacterized membrane protein YdjX (TVP38/TMEM64 family)
VKPNSEPAGTKRGLQAIAGAALLVLLIAGAVVFYMTWGDLAQILPVELSATYVADIIRSWGAWAMLGSVLMMVAHSFVPLPSEFIAIANGMVFGLVAGTIVTWVGAMVGAILAFALARWLGRRFVHAVLPERHSAAIDEWAQNKGTPVLLISRFLPVVSFNLINYAAGLTSVSWWTFLWTTGLGITPLTFLMVFAGDRMMSGNWKLALALISAVVAVGLLAYVFARNHKPKI